MFIRAVFLITMMSFPSAKAESNRYGWEGMGLPGAKVEFASDAKASKVCHRVMYLRGLPAG